LGTLAMEDAHETMRAAGLHIGRLGTGIANYYRKLGWERAGIQRTFTFDRRNVTFLPAVPDLDVTEDWRRYVQELCAVYTGGGVGASRDPERFELLALRKADRIFVARRRAKVAAYVALSGPSVREYAGTASDVAGLLRWVFAAIEEVPDQSTDRTGGQGGQYEMTVMTPPVGELPEHLLALGVPASTGYQGMIKILDAPGLFGTLRIEGDVERWGDAWRVRAGGREAHLSDGELVKLVFGPERRPDIAPESFPVPFYQWPMDRV
jgi:hypothetical protein